MWGMLISVKKVMLITVRIKMAAGLLAAVLTVVRQSTCVCRLQIRGLNKIPDEVTDRQALLVGDVLATGYWATRISEITEDDTVLIIGAGPTGICTLLCVMLKNPKHIIMCEKDEDRIRFINKHYPDVLTVSPEECEELC